MWRRVGIAAAGFAILAGGLALVVVPVPGTTFVVVPLGLAVLAKEFAWARRVIAWSKAILRALRERCLRGNRVTVRVGRMFGPPRVWVA